MVCPQHGQSVAAPVRSGKPTHQRRRSRYSHPVNLVPNAVLGVTSIHAVVLGMRCKVKRHASCTGREWRRLRARAVWRWFDHHFCDRCSPSMLCGSSKGDHVANGWKVAPKVLLNCCTCTFQSAGMHRTSSGKHNVRPRSRKQRLAARRATGSSVRGSLMPRPPKRRGSVHWAHSVSDNFRHPSASPRHDRTQALAVPTSRSRAVQSIPRNMCITLHASKQYRNNRCCTCGSPRCPNKEHASCK